MSKLIFNPEKDMKELEKYGFQEYSNSWNRSYKSNDIITAINKETKEVVDIDTEYGFFRMKNLGPSKRVDDLKKANLIIDEEELKDGTLG